MNATSPQVGLVQSDSAIFITTIQIYRFLFQHMRNLMAILIFGYDVVAKNCTLSRPGSLDPLE